jgi:two-component system, NarL family, sensor kinase
MVIEAVRERWGAAPPLVLPVVTISVSALVVVAVPVDRIAFPLLVAWMVGWLTLPVAGAVLLDIAPGDRAGTVLSLAGLSPALATLAVGQQGIDAAVAASYRSAPALALLGVLLPLAFPTPVPGRAARGVAALAIGLAAAATAAGAVARLIGQPTPRPWLAGGLATAALAVPALLLSARHWRRLLPPDRDRRGWLLLGTLLWWGAVEAAAVVLTDRVAAGPAAVYVLAGLTCALAAGIVLLRLTAEPVPLDLALARAGAAALAVGGVTLTYLVAVALLAHVGLPDSRVAAAVLAALVAVALLPVWAAARNRLAARALGTGHGSPAAVLADLGRRLAQPLDQQDLLDSLAEGVAAAVRSPQVTIVLSGDQVAEGPGVTVVPLDWAGDRVGQLVVRPRRAGERFRSRDVRLLAQLAPPVAAVAASAALGRRLEESEAARAAAARREREGVRRDLHDDLGPLLAGIGMHLASAAAALPEDGVAAAARRRIEAAAEGVEASRAAVRRLVDALAPAGARGLAPAVKAVVAGWAEAAHGRPTFVAEVEPDVDLPPAGTATLLRILGEAVTNVVRHADADCCRVRLTRQGRDVVLDVLDDGVGGAGIDGIGVGTVSMRQRAEELGGRLTITGLTPRGTHVQAVVPVEEVA